MTNPASDVTHGVQMEEFAADFGSLQDEYATALSSPIKASGAGAGLRAASPDAMSQNLTAVLQIPVVVKAVLGSASVPIAALMKMRRGTVVALDRRVGEPIELVVNGRVVARGEVVVLEDGAPHLGISLTEVVSRYGSAAEDGSAGRAVSPPQH